MAYKANPQIEATGYGVQGVTWLPDFTNPLFNFFGRGGILPIFRWNVVDGANLWVNPSVPVIGLAGVQPGQIILQPLIDNRGGVNGL